MHICLCLFACICAREYLCKNTCCITFALLQEKALVLLLINTSLAEVTDWEGLQECAFLCLFMYMSMCVFFLLASTGTTFIKMCDSKKQLGT